MTNLITKLTTALTNTVLFAAAIVMAGLGFAFLGTLTLFGVMTVGVAILVSPFVKRAQPAPVCPDIKV